MTEKMTINDVRRQEILGTTGDYKSGGCESFGNLTLDDLNLLLTEGFICMDGSHNSCPAINDLKEFLEKYPEFVLSGYAVSPERDDCRVSIDQIQGQAESKDAFRAFIRMFRFADEFEFDMDDMTCYAWFD